jgi:hypothetical protein
MLAVSMCVLVSVSCSKNHVRMGGDEAGDYAESPWSGDEHGMERSRAQRYEMFGFSIAVCPVKLCSTTRPVVTMLCLSRYCIEKRVQS